MRESTMALLTSSAALLERHIHDVDYTISENGKVHVILNKELPFTLSVEEIEAFVTASNKILWVLRALGNRINLTTAEIDWWYYNRYLNSSTN